MKHPPKTVKQLRRTNRGNVPGVLGMEEMAMLAGSESNDACLNRIEAGLAALKSHTPDAVRAPTMTWTPLVQNVTQSSAGYWIIGSRDQYGLLFKAVPPMCSHVDAFNAGYGLESIERLKQACESHRARSREL